MTMYSANLTLDLGDYHVRSRRLLRKIPARYTNDLGHIGQAEAAEAAKAKLSSELDANAKMLEELATSWEERLVSSQAPNRRDCM